MKNDSNEKSVKEENTDSDSDKRKNIMPRKILLQDFIPLTKWTEINLMYI